MPVGKRPDISLREKVAELQRQATLFGNCVSGDYTVIDLVSDMSHRDRACNNLPRKDIRQRLIF